jgi:hypothetical protein
MTWRVLTDGHGGTTGPLSSAEIVEWLWAGGTDCLWAEPVDGGEAASPQDLLEVRKLLLAEPERLASAFLRHSPEWVFLWVLERAQQHPDEALPLVTALVRIARGDEDLAHVAIGPIGELLVHHGHAVIDRFEEMAAVDDRFRRALTGVGPTDIDKDVWRRVSLIVADYLREAD